MRGLPLNGNLTAAGARFVREALTEPRYRLWSIEDRHPAMLRASAGGRAIAVEVWAVPVAGLARILLAEPPGLCIGKVRLADGAETLGVLGEPGLCEGMREITDFGGWRAYLAASGATAERRLGDSRSSRKTPRAPRGRPGRA
jgi:allophanate hydrolase-like protein